MRPIFRASCFFLIANPDQHQTLVCRHSLGLHHDYSQLCFIAWSTRCLLNFVFLHDFSQGPAVFVCLLDLSLCLVNFILEPYLCIDPGFQESVESNSAHVVMFHPVEKFVC